MTPPPPVGEYSIVTFCLLLKSTCSTADKKLLYCILPLVGVESRLLLLLNTGVKDKAFYGTERYVVEVEVMDFDPFFYISNHRKSSLSMKKIQNPILYRNYFQK